MAFVRTIMSLQTQSDETLLRQQSTTMAAPQPGLIPPPNQSGIALPPLPHNPPIYGDIAYAVDYVNQLSWSRTNNQGNPRPATDDEVGRAEVYKAVLTFAVAPQAFAPAWLQAFQAHIDNQFHALNANTVDQLSRSRTDLQDNRATAEGVGQAEAYKAALTFAVAPAAAPAWVQALQAHIDNQFDALNIRIATEIQQLRVEQSILSENSRAGNFGPLYDPTVLGQWVLLAAPNPTCRSDLLMFDQAQCIQSADALGLPPLPVNADLLARKRQIAAKIGVAHCH